MLGAPSPCSFLLAFQWPPLPPPPLLNERTFWMTPCWYANRIYVNFLLLLMISLNSRIIFVASLGLSALSYSNGIRTRNHLICKRILNHLASLAKWLSVRLRTKWLWVGVPLLSLELQISRLFRARSSLILRQL